MTEPNAWGDFVERVRDGQLTDNQREDAEYEAFFAPNTPPHDAEYEAFFQPFPKETK